MNLDLFKDKKSLIFINSQVEFLSMKTDEDFTSLEDFVIIDEDDLITYQSESVFGITTADFRPDRFFVFKNNQYKYDLIIEVSFQKITYETLNELSKNFTKKIIGLRIMTFEFVDAFSKKDYDQELGVTNKTETLIIRPKDILEREVENGTYDLSSLIKEFKRDNKLNDLGI
jgi:hypothetical protein